jgi:hypothetical protein
MWINWKPDANFFEKLVRIDRDCAALFQQTGCPRCGGDLHRADYRRKPRGWLEAAGETMGIRFSLCCSRRGCRKRLTPPSVRFLGRKVYFGAMVLVASIIWVLTAVAGKLVANVPARTVWRCTVPTTAWWRTVSGHFRSTLPLREHLPLSLLERFAGDETERIHRALALLAPLTTQSAPSLMVA